MYKHYPVGIAGKQLYADGVVSSFMSYARIMMWARKNTPCGWGGGGGHTLPKCVLLRVYF